jgi:hypothetical protein
LDYGTRRSRFNARANHGTERNANHDHGIGDLVSDAGVDTEPHLHRRSSFGVIF